MTDSERAQGVERLVTFTDAVVAIAITLLALPLIEGDHTGAVGTILREHWQVLLGFTISFFVIARLWWAHHRIFAHVVRGTALLLVLNFVWLFTIVLIPAVTALTTAMNPSEDAARVALYLATMLFSSLLLTSMSLLVHRSPQLTDGQDTQSLHRLIGSVESTAGFALALVIGVLLPVVNYYATFVLVLTGRLDRPVAALLARRRHERG